MKNIVNILKIAVLTTVIIFLMAACDTGSHDDDDEDGPTHYAGTLEIDGQQVWVQNKKAIRQNDDWYLEYEGDNNIKVVTGFSYDAQGNVINFQKSAGSGTIDKGVLSFKVPELSPKDLVNADVLNSFFKEYKEVTFNPSDVKGNNIIPTTSPNNEYLNREGLFLLNTSVGLESVIFVYVDKDCRITGKPAEISWDKEERSYISRTDSALDISLKKGWNTLYRMEVFNDHGYDNVSMGINNPGGFRWVIYIKEE